MLTTVVKSRKEEDRGNQYQKRSSLKKNKPLKINVYLTKLCNVKRRKKKKRIAQDFASRFIRKVNIK